MIINTMLRNTPRINSHMINPVWMEDPEKEKLWRPSASDAIRIVYKKGLFRYSTRFSSV